MSSSAMSSTAAVRAARVTASHTGAARAAALRWPEDTAALLSRRHLRLPSVLLIAPGLAPPALKPFEDWARTTADDAEVAARRLSLELRHRAPWSPPSLDDGVVRFRGKGRGLAVTDAHIVALLLANLGNAVPLAEIEAVGWPGARASTNAVRLRLMRLRRVLGEMDLDLRSVRSFGYAIVVPRAVVEGADIDLQCEGGTPQPRRSGGASPASAPRPANLRLAQRLEIVLVRWPQERARLRSLRAEGFGALLLVEPQQAPSIGLMPHEDWVRTTADAVEVRARLAALNAPFSGPQSDRPTIDHLGVLRHDGHWLTLAPIDSRIVHALLDRFGDVVPTSEIKDAGWSDPQLSSDVLRVHMLRLRRRIEPVGLRVQTVRCTGYAMVLAPAAEGQR
jgi:DNA-binding response OmpR family regulator